MSVGGDRLEMLPSGPVLLGFFRLDRPYVVERSRKAFGQTGRTYGLPRASRHVGIPWVLEFLQRFERYAAGSFANRHFEFAFETVLLRVCILTLRGPRTVLVTIKRKKVAVGDGIARVSHSPHLGVLLRL
jgi:hypothetical protein